jgi:hypothetical protein
MRSKGTAGLLVCALVWAALAFAPAWGASGVGTVGTEPAPGVARLSIVRSGSVVVTRGDDRTKIVGIVNTPLMPGDAFATAGANARAEIQLDGFTSLRLGDGVEGRIVANDARAREIDVTNGLVELAVLRGGDLATEIVTPAVTLRTHYAGDYRISVDAAGTTSVTARTGQIDAVAPHKTYALLAGQTLIARGAAGGPTVELRKEIARDSFDDFNLARDRTLLGALEGDTHVPASIAGFDDLDAYGQWTDVASYGQVWVPQQSADWAPYRDGQWTNQANYGMTWVGNEPWGWTPYHYGRWIFVAGHGWCWSPPGFGLVPSWAPGLVGFFGYGSGPFGYSGLGWVPLAPYETYYPWYPWYWYAGTPNPGGSHPGRKYYPPPSPPPPPHHRHGPPAHMTPLATQFRNARFGGVSGVGDGTWRDGKAMHPIAVDPQHLAKVTIVRGRLPSVPSAPVRAPVMAGTPAIPTAPAWQLEFERAASILSAPQAPIVPTGPTLRTSLPVMRTTTPVTRTTSPVNRTAPPVMHVSPPVMHESPPVMHESPPSTQSHGGHSGSSGGSAHPPA